MDARARARAAMSLIAPAMAVETAGAAASFAAVGTPAAAVEVGGVASSLSSSAAVAESSGSVGVGGAAADDGEDGAAAAERRSSRFRRICVYCGSAKGRKASYQDAAVDLGNELVITTSLLANLADAGIGVTRRAASLWGFGGLFSRSVGE